MQNGEYDVAMTDMNKSRNGWCNKCCLHYKSLTDRWKNCRSLKAWWGKLSAAEMKEWFRKQHQVPTGVKRKFDDVMYREGTSINTALNITNYL